MDLPLLDLDDDQPTAVPDPQTAAGLSLAERGDWHAAAESFAAALSAREADAGAREGGDVALAVALTNLGQARAHLGALTDGAALLERSVAERGRLVASRIAGPIVVVRGLVDLAAVRAAAGDTEGAREALRRANAELPEGNDVLGATLAEGLALLDAVA